MGLLTDDPANYLIPTYIAKDHNFVYKGSNPNCWHYQCTKCKMDLFHGKFSNKYYNDKLQTYFKLLKCDEYIIKSIIT